MRYEFRSLTDKKEWSSFFTSFGNDALFQSYEWGEVQEKLGNQVQRFGIYTGKQLHGIFQVVKVNARRGSFLHVRHGPIFSHGTQELWEETTGFLAALSKKERVWFFRISPLIPPTSELLTMLKKLGYKEAAIHAMDAEHCWVLPLHQSEPELLQSFRKTTRYEIRRAEKLGVTIQKTTKESDLSLFFGLYDETAKRHGFVPHRGIQEEFSIFAKEHRALLLLGFHEKNIIAGAIILFLHSQAIYHHGASISSKVPASYLIQWEAIQEAKKRGLKLYNFWGIAPDDTPNHPWQGITLFKKGFGGNAVTFVHAQDYPVSPLYMLPRSVEAVRRIKKGY